jgi:small-conductance mechanosensitive channel
MNDESHERSDHEDLAFPPPADSRDVRASLLVIVPALAFLATLAARYTLTTPACGSTSARVLLEVVALLGALAAAAPGFEIMRRVGLRELRSSSDLGGREGSHRMLQQLGLLVSVFFTLLVIAIWIPSLVLSPCYG